MMANYSRQEPAVGCYYLVMTFIYLYSDKIPHPSFVVMMFFFQFQILITDSTVSVKLDDICIVLLV